MEGAEALAKPGAKAAFPCSQIWRYTMNIRRCEGE